MLRGDFDFPDGTTVPAIGQSRNGYYRSRATDRITLNRRQEGTVQQGLFRCRIRTQSSPSLLQKFYIGVYDAGSGELCECVAICCLCQFSMLLSDFVQECPWSVVYLLMGKI